MNHDNQSKWAREVSISYLIGYEDKTNFLQQHSKVKNIQESKYCHSFIAIGSHAEKKKLL